MFNYKHVLDSTTGRRYCICSAMLVNDVLDTRPYGHNTYEIALADEADDGGVIDGVTLDINNSGYPVCITRWLSPPRASYRDEAGIIQESLADVFVEGTTLIAASAPHTERDVILRLTQNPPASRGEVSGMVKALEAVMLAEGGTSEEIAAMADEVCSLLNLSEEDR